MNAEEAWERFVKSLPDTGPDVEDDTSVSAKLDTIAAQGNEIKTILDNQAEEEKEEDAQSADQPESPLGAMGMGGAPMPGAPPAGGAPPADGQGGNPLSQMLGGGAPPMTKSDIDKASLGGIGMGTTEDKLDAILDLLRQVVKGESVDKESTIAKAINVTQTADPDGTDASSDSGNVPPAATPAVTPGSGNDADSSAQGIASAPPSAQPKFYTSNNPWVMSLLKKYDDGEDGKSPRYTLKTQDDYIADYNHGVKLPMVYEKTLFSTPKMIPSDDGWSLPKPALDENGKEIMLPVRYGFTLGGTGLSKAAHLEGDDRAIAREALDQVLAATHRLKRAQGTPESIVALAERLGYSDRNGLAELRNGLDKMDNYRADWRTAHENDPDYDPDGYLEDLYVWADEGETEPTYKGKLNPEFGKGLEFVDPLAAQALMQSLVGEFYGRGYKPSMSGLDEMERSQLTKQDLSDLTKLVDDPNYINMVRRVLSEDRRHGGKATVGDAATQALDKLWRDTRGTDAIQYLAKRNAKNIPDGGAHFTEALSNPLATRLLTSDPEVSAALDELNDLRSELGIEHADLNAPNMGANLSRTNQARVNSALDKLWDAVRGQFSRQEYLDLPGASPDRGMTASVKPAWTAQDKLDLFKDTGISDEYTMSNVMHDPEFVSAYQEYARSKVLLDRLNGKLSSGEDVGDAVAKVTKDMATAKKKLESAINASKEKSDNALADLEDKLGQYSYSDRPNRSRKDEEAAWFEEHPERDLGSILWQAMRSRDRKSDPASRRVKAQDAYINGDDLSEFTPEDFGMDYDQPTFQQYISLPNQIKPLVEREIRRRYGVSVADLPDDDTIYARDPRYASKLRSNPTIAWYDKDAPEGWRGAERTRFGNGAEYQQWADRFREPYELIRKTYLAESNPRMELTLKDFTKGAIPESYREDTWHPNTFNALKDLVMKMTDTGSDPLSPIDKDGYRSNLMAEYVKSHPALAPYVPILSTLYRNYSGSTNFWQYLHADPEEASAFVARYLMYLRDLRLDGETEKYDRLVADPGMDEPEYGKVRVSGIWHTQSQLNDVDKAIVDALVRRYYYPPSSKLYPLREYLNDRLAGQKSGDLLNEVIEKVLLKYPEFDGSHGGYYGKTADWLDSLADTGVFSNDKYHFRNMVDAGPDPLDGEPYPELKLAQGELLERRGNVRSQNRFESNNGNLLVPGANSEERINRYRKFNDRFRAGDVKVVVKPRPDGRSRSGIDDGVANNPEPIDTHTSIEKLTPDDISDLIRELAETNEWARGKRAPLSREYFDYRVNRAVQDLTSEYKLAKADPSPERAHELVRSWIDQVGRNYEMGLANTHMKSERDSLRSGYRVPGTEMPVQNFLKFYTDVANDPRFNKENGGITAKVTEDDLLDIIMAATKTKDMEGKSDEEKRKIKGSMNILRRELSVLDDLGQNYIGLGRLYSTSDKEEEKSKILEKQGALSAQIRYIIDLMRNTANKSDVIDPVKNYLKLIGADQVRLDREAYKTIQNARAGNESKLTAPMNEFNPKSGQDIDQKAADDNRKSVRRVRNYLEMRAEAAANKAKYGDMY